MTDSLILHVNGDLELRQLGLQHADALFALEKEMTHLAQVEEGWYSPLNLAGARQLIQTGLDLYRQQRGVRCGIWYQGRLGGLIQLERKQYGHTAGIDYGLIPAFRGCGLMTQSCAAMIRFAFEKWDLHRVEIWVDVVNVKSCAIPERLGFVKKGVLREMAYYGDFYGDAAVYALLKAEWLAQQQSV